MAENNKENQIIELLEKPVAEIGYEIVRVKFLKIDEIKTLQIMIDHIDESQQINIDDCEKVSHLVSALLDVEDIIDDKYHLEVSSPGIDRPLVKIKDYMKFKGFEAKFKTNMLIAGAKKFKGKILDVEDTKIKLLMKNNSEEVFIDIEDIESAQLVLNDELIKASQNKL